MLEAPIALEDKKEFSYEEWLRLGELRDGILRIDKTIVSPSTLSVWLMELRQMKDHNTIKVLIHSPGGGAYAALALYDALRNSGKRIECIVEGYAASAAAMIVLQAGDVRIARPSARFLLHEIRRWMFFGIERTSDLQDELDEQRAIEKTVAQIMAQKSGKTPEEVKKTFERKEVGFSAQEALKWGLIDKIE